MTDALNLQPIRIMSTQLISSTGLRLATENPNHHLWNNHGTWFLHYTVHPTPFTKERVRRSLGTKSLETARERRDAFFAHARVPRPLHFETTRETTAA